MNNEATLERVTPVEGNGEVKLNKRYEGTISALQVLATQRNTKLLSFMLNHNNDTEELLSYLHKTDRTPFANFLGHFYVRNVEKESATRER